MLFPKPVMDCIIPYKFYIEFLLKIQAQYPNRIIINTLDKNVVEIIREVEKKINLKSKITYYTVVKNKKDFTLNKKE